MNMQIVLESTMGASTWIADAYLFLCELLGELQEGSGFTYSLTSFAGVTGAGDPVIHHHDFPEGRVTAGREHLLDAIRGIKLESGTTGTPEDLQLVLADLLASKGMYGVPQEQLLMIFTDSYRVHVKVETGGVRKAILFAPAAADVDVELPFVTGNGPSGHIPLVTIPLESLGEAWNEVDRSGLMQMII